MTAEPTPQSLTQALLLFLQKYITPVAGYHLPLDGFSKSGELFDSLNRTEERNHPHRDQWGNWEGSFCRAHREGKLLQPYLDEEILAYSQRYLSTHPEIQPRDKYPQGHSFALCITHDTDNINYFPSLRAMHAILSRYLRCGLTHPEAFKTHILKAVKDLLCNRGKNLAHRDFSRFIELEQSLGFRSTFYLFSPHLPQPHYYDSCYNTSDDLLFRGKRVSLGTMAKTIQREGWDIGLHGSYNSALLPGVLKQEKQALETALGFEVQSSRQHWLHFEIKTTPLLHEEAGFSSDSTLGFNRFLGFRSSVAHPHKLWNSAQDRAFSPWQIPLNIMDGTLFYGNALELDEALAISQCLEMMQRVAAVGGVLTLNWHPDHLNKEHFFRVYARILEEAAKLNAWGCSAAQLAAHWEAKNI